MLSFSASAVLQRPRALQATPVTYAVRHALLLCFSWTSAASCLRGDMGHAVRHAHLLRSQPHPQQLFLEGWTVPVKPSLEWISAVFHSLHAGATWDMQYGMRTFPGASPTHSAVVRHFLKGWRPYLREWGLGPGDAIGLARRDPQHLGRLHITALPGGRASADPAVTMRYFYIASELVSSLFPITCLIYIPTQIHFT